MSWQAVSNMIRKQEHEALNMSKNIISCAKHICTYSYTHTTYTPYMPHTPDHTDTHTYMPYMADTPNHTHTYTQRPQTCHTCRQTLHINKTYTHTLTLIHAHMPHKCTDLTHIHTELCLQ